MQSTTTEFKQTLARVSSTPHHTLHEKRTARFIAQSLSALVEPLTTPARGSSFPDIYRIWIQFHQEITIDEARLMNNFTLINHFQL